VDWCKKTIVENVDDKTKKKGQRIIKKKQKKNRKFGYIIKLMKFRMGDAQRETLFFVCTGTQIDFVFPFF
jgi:hypothetical protein